MKTQTKPFAAAAENVIDAIGNTPLVKLAVKSPTLIYAKLEHLNPGGSIKDRAALFMIEEAERTGLLKPGGTIIEASSGNQGIASAMIGAVKGYRVIITVSEKVSKEKQATLQAYGVEVVVCKAASLLEDPEGYHATAVKIHASIPGSFMLNQYFNPTNSEAHYQLLGPEIWRQTEGKITHYMAATGTGGTVTGAGKYLKEKNPNIHVIGVDAATSYRSTKGNPTPYKLEGIGVDFEGPLLDSSVIDEFIPVTDADAIATLKLLARTQGLLVGPSSGAVGYAALEYANKLTSNDLMVVIFGDSGRAYLTKNFY